MFEFFKLAWDYVVLRDAHQKGQLKLRTTLLGLGFAVLLYAVAIPPAILYSHHPQYKPLLIAALALDVILVIAFIVIAGRAYLRSLKSPPDPPNS